MSFDLVVVGAGPGGYVAAIRAAELGLTVACIEQDPFFGGTCLNRGCIPSKTLLQSSEMIDTLKKQGKHHGIIGTFSVDFDAMMKRKEEVVSYFRSGIASLFQKYKITAISGKASLSSPTSLLVQGKTVEGKAILLATGSKPKDLPFLKIDEKKILSSTGALSLQTIPKRLLVIGAGVIGVELGSVYQRLGSQVTFIEFADRVCPAFDSSLSSELYKLLKEQGLTFHLSSKVERAEISSEGVLLYVSKEGTNLNLAGDLVLLAVGRDPYTEGLNLASVGIQTDPRGLIPVDGSFRTNVPSIFAIGDLIDGPMLAHKASDEGTAVAELLAGLTPQVDYAAIPSVIYTHPEVASVGLSEEEVKTHGFDYKIGKASFKHNSRAKCTGDAEGFVKIIAEKPTGKILGIHIIGPHASELISEAALAIHKRLSLNDIIYTSHAHPTLSETIKEAACQIR